MTGAESPPAAGFLRERDRELGLAVIAALKLWSSPRYSRFLLKPKPGDLDADWFKTFVGTWAVVRTIRSGCLDKVRTYLDVDFRDEINRTDPARVVDTAAEHIQRKGWSSKTRKDGTASLPISLVSKIGFLFNPDRVTPLDSYACKGLNTLRRPKREGGEGRIEVVKYSHYLAAFDAMYEQCRAMIEKETSQGWVSSLARRLQCSERWLTSPRFRRKVFDNFLMQLGGREGLDD